MLEGQETKLNRALELCRALAHALAVLGPCSEAKHESHTKETSELMAKLDSQVQGLGGVRNAVFSPIERLPNEIMSDIFCMIDEDRWLAKQNLPLKLGTISIHWRAVAFHTPAIWTHLQFGSLCNNDSYGSRVNPTPRIDIQIVKAKEWLCLAKSAPLSLVVGIDDYNQPRGDGHLCIPVIDEICRTVLERDARIKYLHFDVIRAHGLALLRRIIASAAPQLKTLRLRRSGPALSAEQQLKFQAILCTPLPNIETIDVNRLPLPDQFIGAESCKNFVIREVENSTIEIIRIIQSFPYLNHLTLAVNSSQFGPEQSPAASIDSLSLSLPLLSSLRLVHFSHLSTIVSAIKMPRLHKLVLESFRWEYTNNVLVADQDLISLMSRFVTVSAPNLACLEIISSPRLLQIQHTYFQRQIPHLRALHLVANRNPHIALATLARAEDGSYPPCPELDELRIEESNWLPELTDSLCAFLRQRHFSPNMRSMKSVILVLESLRPAVLVGRTLNQNYLQAPEGQASLGAAPRDFQQELGRISQ